MIIMSASARRPVETLIACLLILAGGALLGAVLKHALAGDEFPIIQLVLMGMGGALALLAGVVLLRRTMLSAGPRILDGHADPHQSTEINSTGA